MSHCYHYGIFFSHPHYFSLLRSSPNQTLQNNYTFFSFVMEDKKLNENGKVEKKKKKNKCNLIHYKVQNINMLKSPYRKKEMLKD